MKEKNIRRVGIFGGTFDPPHIGHLLMAKEAYEKLKLDIVWFMPNHVPAYKMAERNVSSSVDRLNMLTRLVENEDWCEVSTIEIEREGNTYTSDTLISLTEANPQDKYYLIIGSDSLKNMHWWHEVGTIFKKAKIVTLLRDEDTKESLTETVKNLCQLYDANITIIENRVINVSSSELRKDIAAFENRDELCKLIPDSVLEYIMINGLYRQ